MTPESLQRRIPFESCFNFRDLGGYRTTDGRSVRWRRLFRSGELQRLTAEEATFARGSLGIGTVIDLRRPEEVGLDGNGLLSEPPVSYHNIVMIYETVSLLDSLEQVRTDPSPLVEDYLRRLMNPVYGSRIVDALAKIADSGTGSTVFHCSAGKDRAGLLAAVVLGVLGVAEEDIVRDYALTAKYIPPQIDHWWKNDPVSSPYFERLPAYMYDARPETMEDMLTTLYRKHGSMTGYVHAQGGTDSLIQRLRGSLLE